jgi:DNA invertase Pin-like site-specific DNA recombinase
MPTDHKTNAGEWLAEIRSERAEIERRLTELRTQQAGLEKALEGPKKPRKPRKPKPE